MPLPGRKVDDWGNVFYDKEGLVHLLLSGYDISHTLEAQPSDDITRFNQLCREFDHPEDQVSLYSQPDMSIEEFDQTLQCQWNIPKEYQEMDVLTWLSERCQTPEQAQRVAEEWVLFEERGLLPLLKLLIFLVDDFRRRKIVWGVGRGSCAASYILFLIGIHKVDALKFDLDYREFLK